MSSFCGTVDTQGKFLPDDPLGFKNSFALFEGKKVTVSVKKYTKKRSNDQNEYLWGVVYTLIADYIGETTESVHDLMKFYFNFKVRNIHGKNVRVPLSTTKLSTTEFITYYEKIQKWASEFLDIYIPDPNEPQPKAKNE